ncbi:hypothetical protein T069G_05633 [Trichoderma breve]|uniref:Uncharacterized protein n=1 Tax=Trichoderma breve TaxID=2034170 RepID=A0A9W9E7Q8_9HYPO|nr:hypothetical protein T069G_05633 [Trichoderma breve]KAJ4860645.1 hypothetical protein T069G_05633 [Trichoderma breve]
MAEAEKHPIIAEKILDVFDLACERSLKDEDEAPSAAMRAVALLAMPGFEECGLPQSWFDFAKQHPKVATTVKDGAKAFAIPGNKTMEDESEKRLLSNFYFLNRSTRAGVGSIL